MTGVGLCRTVKWLLACNPQYLLKLRIPVLLEVRLFSSAVISPNNKGKNATPEYVKRDTQYKTTKQLTIATIVSLLGLRPFTALKIVSENKTLRKVTNYRIKKNYLICTQKFITNETLINHPELLTVDDIGKKISEITKLPCDINDVAVLLTLPLNCLKKFVAIELKAEGGHGKIQILSQLLQISEARACEFIANRSFLRSLSVERIAQKLNLLLDFGIALEDICNDLWVLRYSNELIQNRLNIAKEHKIDTMKTWMVRARPEIFQTYIQRRSDNKLILGNSSLAEYLSERLECSVEVANYLILKQPALANKSLKKLKELIDFLYNAGFKPQHICRVPKILVHSVETTRKRLKQLEDKNIKIDSVYMLTKSQKQFTQFYEASLKTKNPKNQTVNI